jgi:hypothetical protein
MTRSDQRAHEFLCRQRQARVWIEAVLEAPLQSNDIYESLASGVVLCRVGNKLWPQSPPLSPSSEDTFNAFMLRENIGLFLNACRSHGFRQEQLFLEDDLFERKNLPRVLIALQTVAETCNKNGQSSIKWPVDEMVEVENRREMIAIRRLNGLDEFDQHKKSKKEEHIASHHHVPQQQQQSEQPTESETSTAAEEQQNQALESEATPVVAVAPAPVLVNDEERRQREEAQQRREKLQQQAEMEVKERHEHSTATATNTVDERSKVDEAALAQKYGGAEKLENIKQIIVELEKRLTYGNSVLHVSVLK